MPTGVYDRSHLKGENSPFWKGGKRYDSKGYILRYTPNHPNRDRKDYVLEHRLVMEEYLGRFLKKDEIVHHLNGIRDDNRIENLQLFEERGEHTKMELTGRKLSEEARKKSSEAHKGQKAWNKGMEMDLKRYPKFGMSGKKHTEETKKKISEANKGKKRSEETRMKMSDTQKGHKLSDETKRKISKAHKKFWKRKKEGL